MSQPGKGDIERHIGKTYSPEAMNIALTVLLLVCVANVFFKSTDSLTDDNINHKLNKLKKILETSSSGYNVYRPANDPHKPFEYFKSFKHINVQHRLRLAEILNFIQTEDNTAFSNSDRTQIYNALMEVLDALELKTVQNNFEISNLKNLYYVVSTKLTEEFTKIQIKDVSAETLLQMAFSPMYVGSGDQYRMYDHIDVAARVRRGQFDDYYMQAQHVRMATADEIVSLISVRNYMSQIAARFAESADILLHFDHISNILYNTGVDLEKYFPKDICNLFFGPETLFFMTNYQFELYLRKYSDYKKEFNLDEVFDFSYQSAHFAEEAKKYAYFDRVKGHTFSTIAYYYYDPTLGIDPVSVEYISKSLIPFNILDYKIPDVNSGAYRNKVVKIMQEILIFPNQEENGRKLFEEFLAELKSSTSEMTHVSQIIAALNNRVVQITTLIKFESLHSELMIDIWKALSNGLVSIFEFRLITELYINDPQALTLYQDTPLLFNFPVEFLQEEKLWTDISAKEDDEESKIARKVKSSVVVIKLDGEPFSEDDEEDEAEMPYQADSNDCQVDRSKRLSHEEL